MVDAVVKAIVVGKVGIRVFPFGKLDNIAGSDDPRFMNCTHIFLIS